MNDQEVTRIRVGGHSVGVIGLKKALQDMADGCSDLSDDAIGSVLLERLSKHNYIPSSMKEAYESALLHEYKKFVGEPIKSDHGKDVEIKVLGPGCHQCDRMMQDVMGVLAEMNAPIDLEHVRDIASIGSYGVLGTPALVINGEVKVVGSVPSPAKIKTWIEQAVKQKR